MCLLHVGGDLDVAADTNCERLVYEPQPVEVGFGKIGVDGGVPTNAVAPAPGRRRISMSGEAPQVTTGMENLNAGEQPVKVLINGQIFILRGEKMYDATGRLVK